jgi:hypothetical protein
LAEHDTERRFFRRSGAIISTQQTSAVANLALVDTNPPRTLIFLRNGNEVTTVNTLFSGNDLNNPITIDQFGNVTR